MSFISTRVIQIDVSGIELQLKRIADAVENALGIGKPSIEPGVDFDPDDYSSVLYTDEEQELIQERLSRRVAGIDVGL